MEQLKQGDKVMVYHNPILCIGKEGEATLKRQHRPDVGDGLSMWFVEFDDEPGQEYLRTVKAD